MSWFQTTFHKSIKIVQQNHLQSHGGSTICNTRQTVSNPKVAVQHNTIDNSVREKQYFTFRDENRGTPIANRHKPVEPRAKSYTEPFVSSRLVCPSSHKLLDPSCARDLPPPINNLSQVPRSTIHTLVHTLADQGWAPCIATQAVHGAVTSSRYIFPG